MGVCTARRGDAAVAVKGGGGGHGQEGAGGGTCAVGGCEVV